METLLQNRNYLLHDSNMKLIAFDIALLILVKNIQANVTLLNDTLVDAASRTLQDFKVAHKIPIGILTSSAGKPIEVKDTNSFTKSDILTNSYFFESINNLINEKIPERTVFPKGTGAHGYFEVTNDITNYTKAKLFEYVGTVIPVFARLSCGQIEKGDSDATLLAFRGLSFKMYTEEGNLDFLNINTPVFNIRSPILYPAAVHAMNRKNPKTNLLDRTSFFDFIILNPMSFHWLFWAASEFGLPRGFRHMNGFPVHTYEIQNERGQCFFVRFKFLAELGHASLTLEEAHNISGTDPEFFIRDFFNSIKSGNFPAWRMEMDVLTEKQAKEANFNPFDVVSLWPNTKYEIVPIGRIVLNRTVENHFLEVEQSAFNPGNLIPGINSPIDMIYKGRVMAYFGSQIRRLGLSYNKIDINRPIRTLYEREKLNSDFNMDEPNYFPNSFDGPIPYLDDAKPLRRMIEPQEDPVNFRQAWYFYNHILKSESQKQRLVDVLVKEILRVVHPIQQKFIFVLSKIDSELARRFSETLLLAKNERFLPASIADLKRAEL